MILKIFIFLLGFGLTIIGFMYIIAYLNLIDNGKFIIRRIECLNAIIGIILMVFAINLNGKEEKNEK